MKTLKQQAGELYLNFENTDHTSAKQVETFLQDLTDTVLVWEKKHSRYEIIEALQKIRIKASASPFIKRAQHWPRGYAGDFETIGYILNGENKAAPSSFAYQIEDFFLRSAICEQHRNKVTKQASLISGILDKKPTAKILSIGCGTSEDIYQCLSQIRPSGCQITLVDIDACALAYSKNKLESIAEKLITIQGNIYKIVRKLEDHFDLVLIGGVFDYLKDNVIIVLLRELAHRLNKEGLLFFTNIAAGNPYRISMEYLSDWVLIERNENDIAGLLNAAGISMPYTIEKDATGLTYLISIKNN